VLARLVDDTLGLLELGCDPYVVTNLQIGSPTVRRVSRPRALAHGTYDDTRFLGSRALTVSMRLKTAAEGCAGVEPGRDMQTLYDAAAAYMHPNRRPTLYWQLPGATSIRKAAVSGETWPQVIAGPKHPTLVLQFVVPTGEVHGVAEDGSSSLCIDITPSGDVESGRVYPEDYSDGGRGPYGPASIIGARTINNPGTAETHWRATIFGAVEQPVLTVNGIEVAFTRNGGVDLLGGTSVTIDTREKTILLNGDPDFPVYDKANFDAWAWEQLLLTPRTNTVMLTGDNLGVSATVNFCWDPNYV
jgi:hypothetical protein